MLKPYAETKQSENEMNKQSKAKLVVVGFGIRVLRAFAFMLIIKCFLLF